MDENKKLASHIVTAGISVLFGVALMKSGMRYSGKALDIVLEKLKRLQESAD